MGKEGEDRGGFLGTVVEKLHLNRMLMFLKNIPQMTGDFRIHEPNTTYCRGHIQYEQYLLEDELLCEFTK